MVTIWEGMRRYFHEEARLSVEVVLFQSYEAQVSALLAAPSDPTPRIDIAWNTNLAYLQADAWSDHRCRPIAMRDTDIAWMTKIVAVSGGPITALADLRNRTLALGSRAKVTDEGMQKLTLGEGSAERIVVKYPAEGGYLPGDTWELYVGADHQVEELIFRRGGPTKPSS